MKKFILIFILLFTIQLVHSQTYIAPPYKQDFEKWVNYFGTKDVPDSSWKTTPITGNLSWRRNNDGANAAWTNPFNGMYTPATEHGHYSARFHGSQSTGVSGSLDLYLNLDNTIYNSWPFSASLDYYIGGVGDTLWWQYSNNGPAGPFINYKIFTYQSSQWQFDTATMFGLNSPTTIFRFKAKCTSGNDIGLDKIQIQNQYSFPSTTFTVPGPVFKDTQVCPGAQFRLSFIDGFRGSDNTFFPNVNTAGWMYSWKAGTTSTIAGSGAPFGFFNNYTPKDFFDTILYQQLFLSVGAFGRTSYGNSPAQSTIPALITMRPWYECYCNAGSASGNDYFDIGSVKLELDSVGNNNFGLLMHNNPVAVSDTFNNDKAVNFNSHFFSQLPKKIYRDSTYRITIANISQYPYSSTFLAGNAVFIDYNRDSVFNSLTEMVGSQNVTVTGSGRYTTTFSFTVPHTAQLGKTGFRVASVNQQPANGIGPCNNTMDYGEVEDYVVDIVNYPCDANFNAGLAVASDTIVCPGYDILFLDTTHSSKDIYSGLSSIWQYSFDGQNWVDITNATYDSVVRNISNNTYLRYKLSCANVPNTPKYSNAVLVQMPNDFPCYTVCTSTSATDSADNGDFKIGNTSFTTGGTHLNNAKAVRQHTSYLDPTLYLNLYTDSLYSLSFYNILKGSTHAPSNYSLFIDYNRNGIFETPSELVYKSVANNTNGLLTGSFTTPTSSGAILNQLTGMRLVHNNDLNFNAANDLGFGVFASGEVEDFAVRLIDKSTISIKDHQPLTNVSVYPSPSNGTLYFTFANKKSLNISLQILSLAGQVVYETSWNNVPSEFKTSVQLGHLKKGAYFAKVTNATQTVTKKLIFQ